jgi:hypothetical protein
MVNSPFSPSPERFQLERDLIFIENHITNPFQFALLNKRALKLFKARWIPGYATVNLLESDIGFESHAIYLLGELDAVISWQWSKKFVKASLASLLAAVTTQAQQSINHIARYSDR